MKSATIRQTQTELTDGTRTSYTYDAASRVQQLYNLKADGSVILGLTYEHDPVGNPTGMLESSGGRVTWTYDPADRLTREQRSGQSAYDTTYSYDPLGNRLVKDASGTRTTYAYDPANQLVTSHDAAGTTTYTFDLSGNLHIVEQPTGQRTTTTWDDQNRQTGVVLPASGIVTNTFRFDGLRYRKQEAQSTTKFLWDVNNYLAETDADDEIQAIYTNEPQQYGNLISQYRKGPTLWLPSYHHFDALGSTRVLTEGADATDTYVFDAWGNELAVSGTTINPFRWVGQVGYYWNQATGTFYVRARVYEPVTGRWMSQDPALHAVLHKMAKALTPYGALGTQSIGHLGRSSSGYRYFALGPLDPSGLDHVGSDLPPAGIAAPAGKKCGITMMNHANPFPDPGYIGRVDAILIGAKTEQEIIAFIRNNECCSVWMVGHRGGDRNPGGIITFDANGGRRVILPSTSFENKLAAAFADNNCEYCTINLYTCQPGAPHEADVVRKRIAESTGCLVCGTKSGYVNIEKPGLDPCTRCDRGWQFTWELPPKGWRGRVHSECVRWEYVTKGVAPYAFGVWECAEYRHYRPMPVYGPPVPPYYR